MRSNALDLNVPFIFDPGQGLPMFDGAELKRFIELATWVAVNDYEAELLMERTGLTLARHRALVDALVVTRGEKARRFTPAASGWTSRACRSTTSWTRPAAATHSAPA